MLTFLMTSFMCSWSLRFSENIKPRCLCVVTFGIGCCKNVRGGEAEFLFVNVISVVLAALNVIAHVLPYSLIMSRSHCKMSVASSIYTTLSYELCKLKYRPRNIIYRLSSGLLVRSDKSMQARGLILSPGGIQR